MPAACRPVAAVASPRLIDTHPASRLLLQILASVSEFERELIRERVSAGLRNARAKGRRVGRPRRILDRQEIVRLREQDGLSWPAIARRTGAGIGTVVRAYGALNGSPEPFQNPPAQAA